ncbi:hypothetical protein EDF56_106330 [Novosphingobium sp. PhB165]|uniref:hypothetical protein n=1 Tax=Novosphingobium sp. PhB165 TaxID=2485105 RepID=UPI001053AC21|nr:hypothetical protein [Novosphingobium sp. PhB165]TCM17214.1 hypothetical protein EDF56_106330 [Novosphingobium sp. PhB165]
MLDIDDIADVVASAVRAATVPLLARIEELERRELPKTIKGDPGEIDMAAVAALVEDAAVRAAAALPPVAPAEVDMASVAALVEDAAARAAAALPPVAPAEVDMAAVAALVEDAAARAAAALPPVAPAEVDMAAVAALVEDAAVRAAAALPPVAPAEVDMAAVAALVEEAATRAAAALPPVTPAEVDMAAVAALVEDAAKRAAAALPPAKDGVGLADALIGKDGQLILTMTDGRIKDLGVVIGSDGETFTLDDFDIVPLEDERSFEFSFTRGVVKHSFEFSFPVMIDRGVYSIEREYVRGDTVSWGGSLWIAQKDSPGKPDTADSGWRLAVKKGRDGRDAK